MGLIVPAVLLVIAVTTSVGFTTIDGNDYDDYDTNTTSAQIYNDTLLESIVEDLDRNLKYRNKNWRYSFAEDMDTDNNGILSQQEITQTLKNGMESIFKILDENNDGVVNKAELSSPKFDVNTISEIAGIYFDMSPDRYYWTYDMRSLDKDEDACLSIGEFEEAINVNSVKQKEVIRDVFNYLDDNNDEKLSLDDFKPKIKQAIGILFKIFDQNNDGYISMDDLDPKIQWDDITSILDLLKQEINGYRMVNSYVQNGAINMNYFLVPFNLDINGDGIVNTLDLYLSADYFFRYDEEELAVISKVLKLIDPDQNGIYTLDEIKQFVVTIWSIFDANHDMNISLEDGYALLQNTFNVDSEKISVLKSYVKYLQSYTQEEFLKLVDYLMQTIDRNENEEISLQEFFQMPELCFEGWRDELCYSPQRFPEPPTALEGDTFFPPSMFIRSRYRQWEIRLKSFFYSVLDSPKFYNLREFDWSGAAEIEAKIENLAPQGEALLNELRHKISSYKQVISYLNGQE